MLHAVSRIPAYIRILAKNLAGKRAAGKYGKKGQVWLIAERGYDAQDNGFAFFSYMTENHPEVECWYVIGKKSRDYRKVRAVSRNTVEPGSAHHMMLLYSSDALISTHAFGYTPDMAAYWHLASRGLFRPQGLSVFLQHGILDKRTAWLSRKHFRPDMFVVSARPECAYVRQGLRQGNAVACTGLARYDRLDGKAAPVVLIMPTWRKWLSGVRGDGFLQSDFRRQWQAVISSREWEKLPAGMTAVFAVHPEMAKYAGCFAESARVSVDRAPDIGRLVRTCAAVLTDYSSVYFDFAYREKPAVFFPFDQARYETEHYSGVFVRHEEFGESSKDPDTAVRLTVKAAAEGKGKCPEAFFLYRDRKNCERTYQEIVRRLPGRRMATGGTNG